MPISRPGAPPPADAGGAPPPLRRGLVLGAGGVLGAAWTMGALQALEDATGVRAGDVDVVLGTSAGSVLAAFVACGVDTGTMAAHQRGVAADGGAPLEYDYEAQGSGFPPPPRLRMGSRRLLMTTARHPRRVTPLAALSAVLPQGRGNLAAVGRLVEAVVGDAGWPRRPDTWVVAMDYDTGRRVPFGRAGAPPAGLAQAVMASCSIPGWYAPVTIGSRRYVDGGACSATSLDLLAPLELDEVYVLAPMASFDHDEPRSVPARLERQLRRVVTRRLLREASRVRSSGARVTLLAPGRRDLEVIGANMMDPRRRESVFETSLHTSRAALAAGAAGGGLAAAG